MAYMIPTWDINGVKKKYREQTVNFLHAIVNRPREVVLIRELMPRDLGLDNWITPPVPENSEITWFDIEVKGKAIAIYKIVSLSEQPTITRLSFFPDKGWVMPQFNLSPLYGLVPVLKKIKSMDALELLQVQYGLENLRMEGWFSEPLASHECFRIDITTGVKPCTGDELVLCGFVADPIEVS